MLLLPRRKFLIGLSSIIVAPAIVRIDNIMPIKALTVGTQFRLIQPFYGFSYPKGAEMSLDGGKTWTEVAFINHKGKIKYYP
jgi:hypothetical protein